jgi:hypothetical protein
MEGVIAIGAFLLLFAAFVVLPSKLMKRQEDED